jgi:O-antigen/teichoic acid export membrane protein
MTELDLMQQASSTINTQAVSWRTRASTRIIFHVSIALVGVLIARVLGSVTQIVLARFMGVADFGMYTTLYTLLGPVVMVTSLGLDMWILRHGNDAELIDRAVGQVLVLRMLATGSLMLLAGLLLFFSNRATAVIPVVFAALGLTLELLLTTINTALRAQIRNYAASFLQVVVALLSIVLIWTLWSEQSPLLAATGYRLVAAVVGLAIGIRFLWQSLRRTVWQPSLIKQMLRQAAPYFTSDLLASVALKADLTLVALFIGAIGAGIYSPALTIINTTFLVPTVAWQVLLPILTRQQPGSRSGRLLMLLTLAASVAYGVAWAIVLFWGSDLIIDLLFRAPYMGAVPLLHIMSLIPLLKSINFCWAMLMIARDRQVLRTKLLSIGAAFNVVANLLVIPWYGLIGAAWVNLITEAVLLACYSYGAWRTVHRPR